MAAIRRITVLSIVTALLSMAGLMPSATAIAAASAWDETDHSAIRLVAAAEAVGDGPTVVAGLQFRLQPGWKIYWRSPGDAGFPPRPDWAASENLAEARLDWPAPSRFSILGFETYGYGDEVVLPITARLDRPGEALRLRGKIDYLTCKEICVPYTAKLTLDLPGGPATPSPFAHLINRYQVRVPGAGGGHGLNLERAEVTSDATGAAMLRVAATASMPFDEPDLFVEGPVELVFGRPRVRFEDGRRRAVLDIPVDGIADLGGPFAGQRITATLVDGGRAAERTLTVGAADPADGALSFAAILGFALLGGLILNLMPCVLPVLSMKVLGVIGHGGGERGHVRLSFLATSAGIITAFLLLAAVLAGLKQAGTTVGWGIQFQHPWFLIAMTLVVALFACNLWGVFEVALPRWIADAGTGAQVHGLGGHFLTGAFAMLLATPCSAPFLGTAIGFALTGTIGDVFAVFAALGIGLALPYLLVAVVPEVATRLPKPGPWMARLRIILGFALAATAVWLLTVLTATVGAMAALAVGVLVAVGGVLLALRRRTPRQSGRLAAMAAAVAVAAFLMPAALPAGMSPAQAIDARAGDALWQPFDEARIAGLVADGKTVFVDVTADWCVTCQVNKSFVLYRGEVLDRLSAESVVAMRADWTRPSDVIARYLAGFGRYGIPFDAVYGPGAPRGIVLPELLSIEVVQTALTKAAGTGNAVAGD
jgi:suppressor for copper-sensitivity B